jgi:D-alanine-D-alanine ligase-like ATP-grasp enzyme
MIDQNLEPWLIEVNTNPCLEETSALLKMLLPRMIDDAFKLTLDVLYPAPKDRGEEGQEPK